MRILAGDIGGTKSLLALFEIRDGAARPVREHRFHSSRYRGLGQIVTEFLAAEGSRPDAACFGVPGAVIDGICRTPNLPWVIDETYLAGESGIPETRLINDFVAAARGIPSLSSKTLQTLQPGSPVESGPKAIIGAGTGCGQAILVPAHGRYRVLATEGGHGDFAPQGPVQRDLLAHLEQRFGHVSVDRVVSGPGLVTIFGFLADGLSPASTETRDLIEQANDKAAAITRLAIEDGDPTCTQALDIFVAAYGAETGNLALRSLPTAGIYIGGGIATRIHEVLGRGPFMNAFLSKGRLRDLLAMIPVHVVLDERLGLLGAAAHAAELVVDG